MTNKTDALINGFRKCGLFPFNPNAIDYKTLPTPKSAPSTLVENIPKELELSNDQPINPSPESASKFLQMLNNKLSESQTESFNNQRNQLVWSGDIEDTNLFTLWRNLMDEVEGPPEYLIIDSSGLDTILEGVGWNCNDKELEDNLQQDLPTDDTEDFDNAVLVVDDANTTNGEPTSDEQDTKVTVCSVNELIEMHTYEIYNPEVAGENSCSNSSILYLEDEETISGQSFDVNRSTLDYVMEIERFLLMNQWKNNLSFNKMNANHPLHQYL
ncbi:uncharacterized protein LOC110677992 [Aedes aegypti]|uniref:Uncharacterized protein n=1 Tax=Aedes aegypti TaxID=7159 RepID=A0A6I8U733_AEDAE|nr:uncharacterized protein LOC110677992 [Aedes aegypti]